MTEFARELLTLAGYAVAILFFAIMVGSMQ